MPEVTVTRARRRLVDWNIIIETYSNSREEGTATYYSVAATNHW